MAAIFQYCHLRDIIFLKAIHYVIIECDSLLPHRTNALPNEQQICFSQNIDDILFTFSVY